jgi:hypothetical protein
MLEASGGARDILARTMPMVNGGPYLDFGSPSGRPPYSSLIELIYAQSIF